MFVNKLICLLLVILNIYFANSLPTKVKPTIFVPASEIMGYKGMLWPLKITNNLGSLKIETCFFVLNPIYICPVGYFKCAYEDQQGKFRLASTDMDDDLTIPLTIIEFRPRAFLIENCAKSVNQKQLPKLKNYMKPTLSSKAKMSSKFFPAITRIKEATTRQPESCNCITNDLTSIDSQSQINDLLSNDISSIDQSFPAYLFDDKGDAIYGTGMVVTILTAIMGFVKMLRDNKSLVRELASAKNSVEEFLKNDQPDETSNKFSGTDKKQEQLLASTFSNAPASNMHSTSNQTQVQLLLFILI